MTGICATILSMWCLAQEYDNPTFGYWSECKIGTWVKYKVVTQTQYRKVETELTKKVLELGPEKIVLENLVKITVNGREVESPEPSNEEIKKKDKKWGPVEK